MFPLHSVKISGDIQSLVVKCQAMENIYSKNRSVIPGKFNSYRSCIKSSIEVIKIQLNPSNLGSK